MGQIQGFSDQIQYILAHRAKMYWIWSEKIPGFVQFEANLPKCTESNLKNPRIYSPIWDQFTHFGPKSGALGLYVRQISVYVNIVH